MKIAGIGRYGAFSSLRQNSAVPGTDRGEDAPAQARNAFCFFSRAFWVLAMVGISLRLLRYAQGRSLWLDEIFLAHNLLDKSATQLLGPLDYRQGAPPLFLLGCKLTMHCLGCSEYALRLMPLLAGLASVCMFALLARRMLAGQAALAAIALFALLEPLVYYSSELKQYSTDVLMAVTILWAMQKLASAADGPSEKRWIAILFGIGIASIFLSHPAVFVLAGASIWLVNSRRYKISRLLPLFSGWTMALICDYIFFLRPLDANGGLQHHWAAAYPPISLGIFAWLCNACRAVFMGYDTMWLRFRFAGAWPAYAAMILSLLGCRNLYRRGVFGVVGWPIFLTLLAALLRKYPFDDRLILFLVPMVVLMIAAGMAGGMMSVKIILLAVVLLPCAAREMMFALHPPRREEIQPVMVYLKNHWQPGDTLYLSHSADTGYLYYRDQVGLSDAPFIHGQWQSSNPAAFADDWQQLARRQRVWILFSHVLPTPDGDERTEFLELLKKQNAISRQTFEATGASIYLFDLNTGGDSVRGNI